MSSNSGSVQPPERRAMLCISAAGQNFHLLNRIVKDLDYDLIEVISADLPEIKNREFSVVFATCDVPVGTLKELRALPGIALAKFALLGGDASTEQVSRELQQVFQFDLFVQRPIKSSLLAVELQMMLADEPGSHEIEDAEEAELKFTNTLKANYVGVLDQRVDSLSQVLTSLQKATSDKVESLRLEALRLAHNMRGTASSFGLAGLSRAASALEAQLAIKDGKFASLSVLLNVIEKEAMELRQRYVDDQGGSKNTFARINVVALMSIPLAEFDENLFSEASLNLTTVNNAAEFKAVTKKVPLDAVLIDLDCDSINGFALARSLRANEGMADLPIGFIRAANNLVPIETDCAHAGGSLVIQRPLDAQDLITSSNVLVNLNENGRPRILLVDDDPDFTALLAGTLAAEGMIVRSTTNPLKTEQLLQEFSADLLIVDARMPEQNGIDLCHQLRSSPRWIDLPILFLTAEKGVDTRIQAYASGADDYLTKPLIVPELLTRVKGRLERAKLLRERLGKGALTGLLLRRSFLERLESAISEAQRQKEDCSICLLDIDHFKNINDTYGHGTGDTVLSSLGKTLSQRFRAGDIRGRWGGEEFILAFPHTTVATIKGAVERLLEEFQLQIFRTGEQTLTAVTFSGGIASYPEDGSSIKELISLADERLYKAKHAGRNQICGLEN